MKPARRISLLCLLLCLALFCCACGQEPSASGVQTLPVVSTAVVIIPTTTAPGGTSSSESTPTPPSPAKTTAVTSSVLPSESESSTEESGEAETTEPESTEAPTEPALTAREIAEIYLAHMDERVKLFQLMIVTPEAICWDNPVMVPDNEELTSKPVAGILYQAKNMESPEQLIALVEGHQAASPLPLFICVDEEGGRVSRIMKTMGTTPIKNMYTYRGDGPVRARENAQTLAKDIRSFGFNLDFAPVADVWSNPENQVIGERAYSDDFTKAAQLVSAAVDGFHRGQVICTLKHFPGHGDTFEDSHDHVAVVSKTLEQLRQEELLPFIAGIKAGADMVMTGHLLVQAIDPDNIATFSYKIVTELLREELDFEGVIITDALEMGAATSVSSGGEACLKALLAGCDILLCPAGQPEHLTACVDYLLSAIENGQLSWERVNESLLRVLELKARYGLLEEEVPAAILPTEAPTEAWTAAPAETWTEAPAETWTEAPAETWTEETSPTP